ncbi:MAG: glycoside hydrolase family 15 protein [Thermoplasmata archaeon]
MVRFLPLGNGRLLVTFDSDMNLMDFYYSKTQSENHGGHPFKNGVMVNGKFTWVDRKIIKDADYLDHTAVGRIYFDFENVEFTSYNSVYPYEDVFLRRIAMKNNNALPVTVSLFFHQNFNIYGNNIGDTAYYEPSGPAIVHYKERRYFLASTRDQDNSSFSSYAIGVKDFGGMEGTWKDAEDGILSMNNISIGSVDSVISHKINIQPGETEELYYFIKCARDPETLKKDVPDYNSLKYMEYRTGNFWKVWSSKKNFGLENNISSLFKRSLFIIRSHMNGIGGIVASSDSDILKSNRDGYYYVWPRDSSIAAYALMNSTHYGPARLFFNFSADTILPGGYFAHKYNLNGTIASSWIPRIIDGKPIIPIQEDETALVLWSLWNYHRRVNDLEFISDIYENLIRKAADFIADFRDEDGLPKPSYDLWEERYGIHAFTIATTYAALIAAAKFSDILGEDSLNRKYADAALKMKESFIRKFYSEENGRFARSLINGKLDFTVDSALFSVWRFGLLQPDDPIMVSTANKIFNKLWVPKVGGLARYENDYYQRIKDDKSIPGNPWIITTLWGADYYSSLGRMDESKNLIDWVVDHAQPSGVFSEQINPYDGKPISVSPLVWSHAEFVITVLNHFNGRKN